MFAEKRKYVVRAEMAGQRADLVLAEMESEVSRQYLQKLFKEKKIFLGRKYLKPSFKVKTGDELIVDFPEPIKMEIEPIPLPLKIVYEDQYLLVVDKDPGVVVHPAENGKFMGKSLVNAALAHVGAGLRGIGGVLRPGIVHRLDKDTSGLIIIAKSDLTHQRLVEMFKNRQIKKKYMALVCGNITEEKGRIEAPIGRSPYNRKKMALDGIKAREAITEFAVLERFKIKEGDFTLVDINLLTGRTHQIRVHFQSIKHALVGDKTYGNEKVNEVFRYRYGLERQFLQAYQMSLLHPITQKKLDLRIGLADDLRLVVENLSKS